MNKPMVIIYIEGGHRDDETLDADFQLDNTNFRRSITRFVEEALRDCEVNMYILTINVCGGREEAIKRFNEDVERQATQKKGKGRPANIARVLLVDSEGAVGKSRGCKAHLNRQAGVRLGRKVKENTVFLMVQCIEALFLADPDGLSRFYQRQGYGFDKGLLIQEVEQAKGGDDRVSVEQIPKTSKKVVHNGAPVGNIPAFIISKAIIGADYRKSDGFELFGFIDPNKASAESPHCNDFINTMRTLLC